MLFDENRNDFRKMQRFYQKKNAKITSKEQNWKNQKLKEISLKDDKCL